MPFPLLPVTPPTPSRCSKITYPCTPLEFKIQGLNRDTASSEDESSNAESREEQKIRPLNFGANNIKISASEARNRHSDKTAHKSKVHRSSGRKLHQPLVELEAHKNTFEDGQKASSKSTPPPDENCDTTLNPAQQFSSEVVVERPSQGVLGKPTGKKFARQDDKETGTGLQANQTVFRSLDSAQEQDASRKRTKSSSHSDDALPPPKQAARRSKRMISPTNKTSDAEQPQNIDTEQSDDDEDEDSNSSKDKPKPSAEAPADDLIQKATAFHNKLRRTLEGNLPEKDCEGYVYIFYDPARPTLLKIGRSEEPSRRAKGISKRCRLELEEVKKIWVRCHKRTESLMKDYFSDFCDVHFCPECNTKHTEWFEIAREPVIAALVKWKEFMDTEKPYDLVTGQLRPFFRDWIKKQEPFFTGGDGKATREHWDRILVTTWIDRFRFRFGIVWELFCKFYWQINTMFAWTVTFLVVRHPLTFLLMGASVVGTFICMSDDHNQPRSRQKSPRKSSEK